MSTIYDSKKIHQYLLLELNRKKTKYLVHEFISGALMIDIWHSGEFYVFQIEQNLAGYSHITEDTGFSTKPDIEFFSIDELKNILQSILI